MHRGTIVPAVQGLQSSKTVFPVPLEKYPAGHLTVSPVPEGQYDPTGHTSPVTVSVGSGRVAPRVQ